jgi:hypothetical protein
LNLIYFFILDGDAQIVFVTWDLKESAEQNPSELIEPIPETVNPDRKFVRLERD